MPVEAANKITFTEILYSVVIATALGRLTFGVTLRNGMILLAVAIILSDWIEYIASLRLTERTPSNVRLFIADVLVLLVWNALVIIPSSSFEWYVVFLSVFFVCQQMWELILGRYNFKQLLMTPTSGLVISYAVMAGIVDLGILNSQIALGVCVVLFIVAKLPAWRTVFDMEKTINL